MPEVCSTVQNRCADASLNPRHPRNERLRLYCLRSTTLPLPSETTAALSFSSLGPPLHGWGMQSTMDLIFPISSYSKTRKYCKDLLPCRAILDEEDSDYTMELAPPPTDGRIDIVLNKSIIQQLDLSPAHAVLRGYTHRKGDKTLQDPKELLRRTVGFVINYEWDDPDDRRELSEMPDVRLWFVLLDAMYPWLPVVLDWRAGELARYTAMLVPHQMKKREGLAFNPEALELFVMSKLFTVYPWLQTIKVAKPDAKVNDMLRILGYKIDAELFQLLESS